MSGAVRFSRFHSRLRRRCSTIASPRLRFVSASARGSLPASVWRRNASRARSIARRPCSRRACGTHASQWRRRRFYDRLSAAGASDRDERGCLGRGVPQALLAYGRGSSPCEASHLVETARRRVDARPFRVGPPVCAWNLGRHESVLDFRDFLASSACLHSARPHCLTVATPRSAARNTCARCATMGARSSRQRPRVSESS